MNQKTFILHPFKNEGGMTRVTGLGIAVNMTDPTCLLVDNKNP